MKKSLLFGLILLANIFLFVGCDYNAEMSALKTLRKINDGVFYIEYEGDYRLDEYIKDTANLDSLILGCTHYGIIKEEIKRKIGKDIDIIDLGEILAINIELNDSFQSVDLHFSKVTNELEENVKKIINVV